MIQAPLNQIEELIELIGDEGLAKLSAVFGGRRLYVPRRIGRHHPIAHVLGQADADRVAERFGGEQLNELPRGRGKRAVIRDLSRQGKPVEMIRAAVGCSRRFVFKVRAEDRTGETAARDPGLFD